MHRAPRGRIEADVRARERTRPAEGWTVWHIPALVWRTRPAEGRGHALHGTSPRWFGGPRVLPAFHARGARVSRSELNLTRAVCHACVREGVSEPNRVITVTDPCPPRRCVVLVGGWIRGMSPGVTRRQRISRRPVGLEIRRKGTCNCIKMSCCGARRMTPCVWLASRNRELQNALEACRLIPSLLSRASFSAAEDRILPRRNSPRLPRSSGRRCRVRSSTWSCIMLFLGGRNDALRTSHTHPIDTPLAFALPERSSVKFWLTFTHSTR